MEESYLSILLEDHSVSNLDRAASNSDIASVNSEESGGQSTTQYASQLSKSPSQEPNSDGSLVAEEIKAQYRMQVILCSFFFATLHMFQACDMSYCKLYVISLFCLDYILVALHHVLSFQCHMALLHPFIHHSQLQ